MNKREKKFLTMALAGAFGLASLGMFAEAGKPRNAGRGMQNAATSMPRAVLNALRCNPNTPFWIIDFSCDDGGDGDGDGTISP